MPVTRGKKFCLIPQAKIIANCLQVAFDAHKHSNDTEIMDEI